MKLRLVLGAVLVASLVVVAGCVGGVVWFAVDDSPLATYDARPATVEEAGLTETGYREVARNDTYVRQSLAPVILFDRDVRLQVHFGVYASGIDGPVGGSGGDGVSGSGGPGTPTGNGSIDVSDASVVTAVSMSALKLGPLEVNPVVHATSPRLLGGSGFVVDYLEGWIPGNLTDVSIQNSESVGMLDRNTRVTTFSAKLRDGNETPVDVTLHLARVTHRGDLVLLMGVYPRTDSDSEAEFRTLIDHLEHGDGSDEE